MQDIELDRQQVEINAVFRTRLLEGTGDEGPEAKRRWPPDTGLQFEEPEMESE